MLFPLEQVTVDDLVERMATTVRQMRKAARLVEADDERVVLALDHLIDEVEQTANAMHGRMLRAEAHVADRIQGIDHGMRAWERGNERAVAGVMGEALAEGIDPRGWFVYTLWGADESRPLYVGMSGNVLARLGQHMNNPLRRPHIHRVGLLRCPDARRMRSTELRLIRHYAPPWNVRDLPM